MVQHPQLRSQLEKLGIDYCCGGLRSLSAAVQAAGLKWRTVEGKLKQTWRSAQKEEPATDWNAATLTVLVDHILDKHHAFTKEQCVF